MPTEEERSHRSIADGLSLPEGHLVPLSQGQPAKKPPRPSRKKDPKDAGPSGPSVSFSEDSGDDRFSRPLGCEYFVVSPRDRLISAYPDFHQARKSARFVDRVMTYAAVRRLGIDPRDPSAWETVVFGDNRRPKRK